MTTEMTIAIQEAIGKHMPGEVGNLLRQRLEEAEADRKRAKKLDEALDDALARIESLQKSIRDEASIGERLNKLAEAEKKLAAEKMTLDHRLQIAEIKQQCAENTAHSVKEVVGLMFCSQVGREIVVKTKQTPIINSNGGYQTGTATETKTTETRTEGPGLPGSAPRSP